MSVRLALLIHDAQYIHWIDLFIAVENHKSINQNSKQKFFLFLFISYQHLINIEGYEFYYCD